MIMDFLVGTIQRSKNLLIEAADKAHAKNRRCLPLDVC